MPRKAVPRADGRHQRSVRSRERMLDAVEAALRESEGAWTPEQVATRAGVSLSTLFRHFGDLEGIAAALRARIGRRIEPLLRDHDFAGDRATRVRELVRRRAAAFEAMGPFQRTGQRRPLGTPGARQAQVLLETMLRDQLEAAIGRDVGGADADGTRALLGALLGFAAWNHLRTVRGFDAERVARLLERGVLALLAAAPD